MPKMPGWKIIAAKRRMAFYQRWPLSPQMLRAMAAEVAEALRMPTRRDSGNLPAVTCSLVDDKIIAKAVLPDGEVLELVITETDS